ncbi:MAG: hypothetical protein ACRDQ4_01460 [Pseudonocardiaceae bacterium]
MRVCCGDTEEKGVTTAHRLWRNVGLPGIAQTLSTPWSTAVCELVTEEMVASTLTVQPVATDTKEFYEYLGWQRVGTTKAPAGAVSPFFDVYLLPLHAKP